MRHHCAANSSFKYREVYTSIYPPFHKVRMILKVVFLAVFQYKQTSFFQQIIFKNKIGKGFQSLQFIRRIGKDEIELLASPFDELEYIATDGDTSIILTSCMILQMKAW